MIIVVDKYRSGPGRCSNTVIPGLTGNEVPLMITLPVAALILLILSGLAGGYLLGHGPSQHRCVICYKPLSRVCTDGRCGDSHDEPNRPRERGGLPPAATS